MQSIMVNRKHFGNFEFSAPFAETFYLFTFHLSAFSLILDNLQKTETETKNPLFLPLFAVICPFLSQIKR
mgnify:CR=1 FL=1